MALRERLLRGEGFQDVEYRLLTEDGRVKWVVSTWAPMYDDAGRQIGIQGCERDITQTKLAEESLRKSEHRIPRTSRTCATGGPNDRPRRRDHFLQRLHPRVDGLVPGGT